MQIRPGVIAIVFLVSEGLAPGPAGPASHGSELPPPAAPATSPAPAPALAPTFNGLTGYFQAGASEPPPENGVYRTEGWGVSWYSGVYPLLKPGKDDSTQLGWGSWILPNPYEDANGVWNPRPKNLDGSFTTFCSPDAALLDQFQSIEGGVGTWGNVKFPVADPMFVLNATNDCYTTEHGGPAYTFGANKALAAKDIYFAQLSNRLLLPPAQIPFENLVQPSLFGHGWIALPIIPANASPYGIPTGTNSWTFFVNGANFKGAVGFFTPAFWTAINQPQKPWLSVGYGLDTRNGVVGSIAMEVGYTNAFSATDAASVEYRRVPRLTFGVDENRRAVLVQDVNRYKKAAIWDTFGPWLNGGAAPSAIGPAGIWRPTIGNPSTSLRMLNGGGNVILGTTVQPVAFTTAGGGSALGLQWDGTLETGVVPEYYKKVNGTWTPIPASQVPASTGLTAQTFPQLKPGTPPALDTSAASVWASSGWAAGPFTTALSNGSVVDYVWYRFVDQPAIARLGLGDADRARLQAWAESVHDQGTNGLTFPPPSSGQLASLDRGLLVTPPAGKTRGYVPIAIAQRPTTADTATWLIPSTARAGGAGGAFYTTDVTIANTGAADATLTLQFLGHDVDGTTGAAKTFTLATGKSVTHADVLGSVFGLTSDYGAIRIRSTSPSLAVASQTWTPAPGGGTFGQSVPAVYAANLAGGGTQSILGIREDASFRTNLALANAGAAAVDVDVSLVDETGSLLGSPQRVTLPPFGMTQLSRVARVLGASGDVRNARLVLSTPTAGGAFASYASVIDASTNDPRTLLPRANGAAVAATSLIPSSARAQGTGGAFYTTDVTIANTGAADATMTLKFLGHDAEGTTGTVKTFALAAGKSVTYTDVLGSVFGVTSGYGAIQIGSSSPSLAVASQTWTPASGGGTFGQSVPAVSVADLAGAGARTILGVREDASFRTNLVLANAGAAPVAVDVSLVDQAGSLLGSTQRVTLPPIGMTQLSRVARVLGATGDVVNARLVLSTSTAGGAFATYASVIDASTNDPRTLLPQ